MKYKLIIDKDAEEEIVATVHAPSSLTQKIEEIIKNQFSETKIIVAGGTALRMELDPRFELYEDAQFAVAIGLFKVAELTF